MYMGAFPVADFLDSDDIILISRDGVHMLQITAQAAGLNGGLKWWIETETDIYREYPSVDMGYAAKVHVGEGQPWECDAYNFMDTYYSDAVIDTVCMMSGKKAYTQPVNALGKVMARDYRSTETVDNCAPNVSAETQVVYVDMFGKFPGDVNPGSRTGYFTTITCQKSDNLPCIAIAGCDIYSISEEHLIKNFPKWTDPTISRYTMWGLPIQAGFQDPHQEEYTVFANHELRSLGENYTSLGWYDSWNPTPLEHHESASTDIPASQWSRGYFPALPNESIGGGSYKLGGGTGSNGIDGSWRRYAIENEDDDVPQKWGSFAAIDWSKDNQNFESQISDLIDGLVPIGGIIEASPDDKPATIRALLESESLNWTYGDFGHQPRTMNDSWKQISENAWQIDYYEVIFEVNSPFVFATKHREPWVVACNTYGKNVDVDIHNVNDYTRNSEYTHYDQHSHLPYGSNINPISTWQVYYDPIHDPAGTSGNYRIDATRNNSGYWGRWADDDVNGTGIYDVTATMPFGLDYQQRDYVWDVALFPTHRGWFDVDDDNRCVCRKGYRNTEYGSLNHHFSITDADGDVHSYPDYVYNDEGKDHDAYDYLSFYHPGYSLYNYDFRLDTIEPSNHYVKDIYAGKFNDEHKIVYDYSLGDHWIFNKNFLESNLEEHIYTDVDAYSLQFNVYDDDITHVTPNPTISYTINIHTLKICKGYTSKLGSGQKAQNSARECFQNFLNTSGIQILDPKFTTGGGGGISTTTSIGVNEQEGFWTGYTEEVDDEENPGNTKKEKHKLAWIDPITGSINTENTYLVKGVDIFKKLQRKLIAGEGISLKDNTEDGTTTISNTMLDVALDIFADAVDCSYGLDFAKNGDVLNFMLKHNITATPAGELPPGSIPISVTRSYDTANNYIIDHLSADVRDLNIPTIAAGHGVSDTGSAAANQHIINSLALDNIKVNGTLVQRQSSEEDGYFVDLDISGGGGGEIEITYPSPVPDYANRQFINSFTAVSNTFIPKEDGYLFLEVRNSALFYVEVEIEGKSYTLGNMDISTSSHSVNDSSNMIPLMKGQKVTMVAKSSSPAISTSSTAANANKFWFIPLTRQKEDATSFTNPNVVYGSYPIASFSTSNLPTEYQASTEPYILTPSSDGVIVSADYYYIQPTAGIVSIEPLDEHDQSLGVYRLFQIPGGSSGMRANQVSSFPVKKGQKYSIYRSSNTMTTGAFNVYAFGTANSADQLISPYLDWNKAETISINLTGTSSWIDIPAPQIIDKPGIMYVDGDANITGDIYNQKIRCNSGSTLNLVFNLNRGSTQGRNYVIMNAYNNRTISTNLKWQYQDNNYFNPLKLVFVPFKKYTIPGIDYAMDNKYNILNNSGMLDLSDIFNRLEALEAEVFPQ